MTGTVTSVTYCNIPCCTRMRQRKNEKPTRKRKKQRQRNQQNRTVRTENDCLFSISKATSVALKSRHFEKKSQPCYWLLENKMRYCYDSKAQVGWSMHTAWLLLNCQEFAKRKSSSLSRSTKSQPAAVTSWPAWVIEYSPRPLPLSDLLV